MNIQTSLRKLYEYFDRPIYGWSRLVLLLLVIPLVLSLTQPLWRIQLHAPQYPDGLWMEIYAHKVEGGNNGQHITEINTLNHYIGMHKIDRAELTDLDWIPFAIGLLVLLTLRCAVIGNIRALIDLAVLTGYVSVFAFGRFVYKLYVFGHNLDPEAPIKLEPFTPSIIGTRHIANFTETSTPELGSILVGIYATGVVVLVVWHLVAGRLAALKEHAVTASPP